MFKVIRFNLLPTSHCHPLEIHPESSGALSTIPRGRVGHKSWAFGQSTVNGTLAVFSPAQTEAKLEQVFAYVVTHKLVDDVLSDEESQSTIMRIGAADYNWLIYAKSSCTPEQSQKLRRNSNRLVEVEQIHRAPEEAPS